MNELQPLLDREQRRQEIVFLAIQAAEGVVKANAQSEEEATFLRYKIGGNMLAKVLESYDKQMLAQDILAIQKENPSWKLPELS